MDASVLERLLNNADEPNPAARLKSAVFQAERDLHDAIRRKTLNIIVEKIPEPLRTDALAFAKMIADDTVRFEIPGCVPFVAVRECSDAIYFYRVKPARWFRKERAEYKRCRSFHEIVMSVTTKKK